MRDPWNILDFVIVISGYITIVQSDTSSGGGGFSLTGRRTLRVLRPLRTISSI